MLLKLKLLYIRLKYRNDVDIMLWVNEIPLKLVYNLIICKNQLIVVYNDCIKILDTGNGNIDNFDYTQTYTII